MDRGTFEVEDPATAEPLCSVADANADDAAKALDAAVDAAPGFTACLQRPNRKQCHTCSPFADKRNARRPLLHRAARAGYPYEGQCSTQPVLATVSDSVKARTASASGSS